jgi:hypothetical protein
MGNEPMRQFSSGGIALAWYASAEAGNKPLLKIKDIADQHTAHRF